MNRVGIAIGFFLILSIAGCVAMRDKPVARPARGQTGVATSTITATKTVTGTATLTATIVPTATMVPTGTATMTGTRTVTATETVTATGTVTATITPTGTMPSTRTPATPTATATRADTPTPAPTVPPTSTPPRPTSFPPTPTPLPPSPPKDTTPVGVDLLSHRSFRTDTDFVVVGEIFNGQEFPVYNVRIIGTFHTTGDQLIAAQEGTTMLPMSEPGLANPFKLVVPNAPADITSYELELAWDDISLVGSSYVAVLSQEIEEPEEDSDEEILRKIVGELQNEQTTALINITVVVTLFDEDWQVVETLMAQPEADTLDPGRGTSFSVELPSDLEFDRFDVQAQGVLDLY